MQSLVSILIPTYNRSRLLKRAIESALLQTYENIEILVFDNASTDSTKDVAATFNNDRFFYYRNCFNVGPIANWRLALNSARGEYSVILSDDDYFIDCEYIEKAVRIFEKYSSVNVVLTDCVFGRNNSRDKSLLGIGECNSGTFFLKKFWTKNFHVPNISNVFKTAKALEVGAFECNDILYSDIELWLKLMLIGDVGYIEYATVYYNFHDSNIVTSMSENQLVKNSKFILNIKNEMSRLNFDSPEINDFVLMLTGRYLKFICVSNSLKLTRRLYSKVTKKVEIRNSPANFYKIKACVLFEKLKLVIYSLTNKFKSYST